ncbi:hypothetical protein [Yersinia phage fHe-Yen9-03]|uniref:Uncharacterized protein n=1 Tax=Yersinia phage fHe-Yen9-03 TaxID=2052743 RepID=A0A2C9CZE3_9CAUD|nr:hypothetical protein [Yersinia phage fHe-Yen9-03]
MKPDYIECLASGAGHNYQKQSIPSEYICGTEGLEPTKVVQCQYCGEEKK